MVKVVIVNGMPGSGKSHFERICSDLTGFFNPLEGFTENRKLAVDITSTVDFVKEIASMCGWDGTKTLENRKFLSDLKALLTAWDNVPYKIIEHRAQTLPGHLDWIMFVDCREPIEIQKLKDGLNATTLLIRRESIENAETSNASDANVFNYDYDLTIWNNYDIINLENEAKNFIEYMRGAPHYDYDN